MAEDLPDNIFTIDPVSPDAAVIEKAAEHVRGGRIVAFPTQTLYGLGTNALDAPSVERIFAIKKRPPDKPVLILVNDIQDIHKLTPDVPPAALKIMEACWPGGVTIVFHAKPGLPSNLTAGTGKIGIRLPLHPVARDLVRFASVPVTGTSANISGRAGCAAIDEMDPRVRERVDMVLDAGALMGGMGSTIVDVTVTPPKILREGTVPERRILEVLSRCTQSC